MTDAQKALEAIEDSLNYLRDPLFDMHVPSAHLLKAIALLPLIRARLDDLITALNFVQENVEASGSSYRERVETIGRIVRAALTPAPAKPGYTLGDIARDEAKRAAPAPVADGEIEAIRAEAIRIQSEMDVATSKGICHPKFDGQSKLLPMVSTLLAHVDRLSAELAAERERSSELLDDLRDVAKAITNGAQDTLWMGDGIADPTIVDFICIRTGDDPSFIGSWERAATLTKD